MEQRLLGKKLPQDNPRDEHVRPGADRSVRVELFGGAIGLGRGRTAERWHRRCRCAKSRIEQQNPSGGGHQHRIGGQAAVDELRTGRFLDGEVVERSQRGEHVEGEPEGDVRGDGKTLQGCEILQRSKGFSFNVFANDAEAPGICDEVEDRDHAGQVYAL